MKHRKKTVWQRVRNKSKSVTWNVRCWWLRQRVIPIAIGVAIGILIAVYTVSAQL